MNADLALMVGVMLGPGGLSMLQSPELGRESGGQSRPGGMSELGERVALLERIARHPAERAAPAAPRG